MKANSKNYCKAGKMGMGGGYGLKKYVEKKIEEDNTTFFNLL
jgi:hypothetical protein